MSGSVEKNSKPAFSIKIDLQRLSSALLTTLAFAILMLLGPVPAAAQPSTVVGANVQKIANSLLTLMGYGLTPDVTTGSLSFSSPSSGNPGLSMSSLGGGFTLSKGFPLYLEGTAAYSRYDPTFVLSDGATSREIPVKWNSLSATGGIGWDFPIVQDLVFRPIFNFSLGTVQSDLRIAGSYLGNQTGKDFSFLDRGRLDAAGLGGSLMLDYERYRPENEIDVELRYTNIFLQSINGSSDAVSGSSDAQTLALWARWRAPTGLTALDRPFRYVLEFSHTQFLGDLRGAMGFDYLTSLGAGFELDTSKYTWLTSRWRLLGRYKFGDGVQGWSIGFAVSF
ncbi:MAG TPA: hypothetical protein VMB77_03720 [Syntrophales bacterium]|nr:hypothetical protein [Syntrophales bacterium]